MKCSLFYDGMVWLDVDDKSILLEKDDHYVVKAGLRHRTRVVGTAQLIVIGGQD